MTEAAIEAEIQAKGLNAPRLTPAYIDAQIAHEFCVRGSEAALIFASDVPRAGPLPPEAMGLECLTICVLTLRNGFTVIGHSACVSPENFNAEIGRKIARENARAQIWALEGYALRSSLADGAVPTSAITGTG